MISSESEPSANRKEEESPNVISREYSSTANVMEGQHLKVVHYEYSATDAENLRQCRICLENEGELIIPCDCKTNPVHRDCLNRWRAEMKEGKNFKRCEICHFEYQIETVQTPSPLLRRQYLRYCGTICWVILQALFIFVGSVSFWAVVCASLDRNHRLVQLVHLSVAQSYLLCGIILFFFTLDLYGIYCMVRRHRLGTGNGPFCCVLTSNSCCPLDSGGCSGGNDGCGIICAILVILIGILIGLFLVYQDVQQATRTHFRILGNYAQVDTTRIVDRSQLFQA